MQVNRTDPPDGAEQASRSLLILVTHLGAGGAERTSVSLANYFSHSMRQVTLATLDSAVPDFYTPDEKVQRIKLSMSGAASGAAVALINNVRRAHALRKAIRASGADVVLAMTTECSVLTIIATLGLSKRVVVAERNYPPKLRINRFWHCLRRATYRFANQVVVQSNDGKQWIERYTRASRVAVIPNSVRVPLPQGQPFVDPDQIVNPDKTVLLAVGRLKEQKGFDVLIESFSKLRDQFPQWVLVIIGDGDQRGILTDQISQAGLTDGVMLPGNVGNIGQWYERCSLFVLSSQFEGFPNVLLEAMAHGRAVVSVDCMTGPREIVRDGIDGRLVQSVGNPDDLAAALEEMMEDDVVRTKMASNAREVCDRYSPKAVNALWQDVL